MRYSILAMYGDREAEQIARQTLSETEHESMYDAVRLIRRFFIARMDQQEWSHRVRPHLSHYQKKGMPFQDYERDPAPISQIKIIENALYRAERVLIIVEGMDVEHLLEVSLDNSILETIKQVPIGDTIEDVYELCRLLTHPDVDLNATFIPEWKMIAPLLQQISTCILSFSKDTNAFLLDHQIDISNPSGVLNQMGTLCGVGLYQLGTPFAHIDDAFLTQFGVALPHYLEQITQYLQQFSSEVQSDTEIDEMKYHELEGNALQLLYSLERLSTKGMLHPRIVMDVIAIVRHGHTLIWNILNEVSHLSETSQEIIKAYLEKLKLEYFAQLMAFSYKVEEEFVSRSGRFSRPMFNKINPLYDELIKIIKRVTDFSYHGRHLVTLQDTIFISACLEQTYQRRSERIYKQLVLDHAIHASNAFFDLLKEHREKAAIPLDEHEKLQIIEHYKAIQPVIASLDARLNHKMIQSLNVTLSIEKEHDWLKQCDEWLSYVLSQPLSSQDHFEKIVKLQPLFDHALNKELQTLHFQQLLSDDLIHDVYESQNTFLLEFSSPSQRHFKLNAPPTSLISAYKFYVSHHQKLMKALHAYQEFCLKLKPYSPDSVLCHLRERHSLQNLYAVFQPIMNTPTLLSVNGALVSAFSGTEQAHLMCVETFRAHEREIEIEFETIENRLKESIVCFEKKLQLLLSEQYQSTVLPAVADVERRATFLIPEPKYAAVMTNIRQSMHLFFEMFQPFMQEMLKPPERGVIETMKRSFALNHVPYPELEVPTVMIQEPSQLLWLKRLANFISHLEEASIQVELLDHYQNEDEGLLQKLNNQRLKAVYVARVVKIEHHIREGIWLLLDLRDDPYLSTLCKDLIQHTQMLLHNLYQLSKPYYIENEDNGVHTKSYDVICYMMNALMVMPKQIAMKGPQPLNAAATQQQARLISDDMYRVIESTHSYFKLFLEAPTVMRLFLKLKEEIKIFSNATHGMAKQCLATLNHDTYASILKEGDLWEANLSLNFGVLTLPTQQLLDTFYHGFWESLQLKSHDYLKLRTSIEPYLQRLKAVDDRVLEATLNIKKISEKKKYAEQFLAISKEFHDQYVAKTMLTAPIYDTYIKIANDILPLLKEAKPRCIYAYWHIIDVLKMDAFFAVTISKDMLHTFDHTVLKKLVEVYILYQEGLINSQKLAIKTHKLQKQYLEGQMSSHKKAGQTIFEDCIRKTLTIDGHLRPYVGGRHGLVYADDAYTHALCAYIKKIEPDILSSIKQTEDIDIQVKCILTDKIHLFEAKNLRGYHQLEKVQAAIARLNQYLNLQSETLKARSITRTFETLSTIKAKKNALKQLECIIHQDALPIYERLTKLTTAIKHPRFQSTLLAYHRYDAFTFQWLMQCVTRLFEFLHLYTPERKKVFDLLQHSVTKTPRHKQFSFFHTLQQPINKSQEDAGVLHITPSLGKI